MKEYVVYYEVPFAPPQNVIDAALAELRGFIPINATELKTGVFYKPTGECSIALTYTWEESTEQ